jgi:LCP family protein required for cell wall assembly
MNILFISVLNMSITASVVAVAAMLFRIPLKKAPKIFSYVLWSVVLFRLICPFSFESIFSLMPASTNIITHDRIYNQTSSLQTGDQFAEIPVNTMIPDASPLVSFENSLTPIQVFLSIAAYVWLIGFAVLLLYAAIGYIILKQRVYFATNKYENVFETDKIKTPFVLGFIRPKIYIPVGVEQTQEEHILKHERTHIKRFDYLIKPIAFIACAIHWFNPFIWAAYFMMSKDMEMSCDEAVLSETGGDIRDIYSSALLNLSLKRMGLLNPLAFGESDVKSRVKNVLRFRKPKKWLLIVYVIIVVIFLAGFISNKADIGSIIGDDNPVQISSDNPLFDSFPNINKINILLIGVDEHSQTDTIILAIFDTDKKHIDLVSIPRDTYFDRGAGYDDPTYNKINAVYGKNPYNTAKAVSEILMDIPISYYVQLSYDNVAEIVDFIGGVPIDIPNNMKYTDPFATPPLNIDIPAGYQILNGENAINFLRYRMGYPDADLGRIKAQQEFLKNAFRKSIDMDLPNIIRTVLKNTQSDISLDAALNMAGKAIGMDSESIRIYTMPIAEIEIFYVIPDNQGIADMLTEIFSM